MKIEDKGGDSAEGELFQEEGEISDVGGAYTELFFLSLIQFFIRSVVIDCTNL